MNGHQIYYLCNRTERVGDTVGMGVVEIWGPRNGAVDF